MEERGKQINQEFLLSGMDPGKEELLIGNQGRERGERY